MGEDLRFEHRMSDADALLWRVEKDPLLRSTITAVVLLGERPARDRLVEAVDRLTRLVPRLRQRVVSNPLSIAPPRWEVDPNFDLSFHLRWCHAAPGSGLTEVLAMAEPMAMAGFDRARPQWEMLAIEGLADDGAALIVKLHHAMTDGVGAVKIAMHLFDLEAQPDPATRVAPDYPEVNVYSRLQRWVDAAEHESRRQRGVAQRMLRQLPQLAHGVATAPAEAVRTVGDTAASVARLAAPAATPLSPTMTGRSLSMRFDVLTTSLDGLKRVAKRADGQLNDAFMAVVLGGLRRYHEAVGPVPDALRVSMPISVRSEATDDLAGNQFAPTRFTVPLDIDDPVARMRAVRALVRQQRNEPALGLVEPLAGVLRRLPTSVAAGLFTTMTKGVDFVASNVPGIPFPLFLAGAPVTAQYAFGPMAGAAANLTLLSYLDEAAIAVNCDPAAVTDLALFRSCLADELERVVDR